MRFPRRSAPERSPEGDEERRHLEQTSLALKVLVRTLEQTSRPNVLDLGVAMEANVAFFSRFGAKISIADLYRSRLSARPSLLESRGGEATFSHALLPVEPSSPFDVIVAWDLLNYLKPEEITWLATSLCRWCKPGAPILAFVALTREIPLLPLRYTIRDEETLVYELSGPRKRPAPRYSEQMLLRLMLGTTVESRFQLRNAMVEYLFSFRGARIAPVDGNSTMPPPPRGKLP